MKPAKLACAALLSAAMLLPAAELKIRLSEARTLGGGHTIVAREQVRETLERGGTLVAEVPGGFIASGAGPGIMRIEPLSKISEAAAAPSAHYLVEFFPDVPDGVAEGIILTAGVPLLMRPDLAPNQYLVQATSPLLLRRLAEYDEVAYIYPASDTLIRGEAVAACLSMHVAMRGAGQYVATWGEGWDGPGQRSARLTWTLGTLTDRIPATVVRQTVARALEEWRRYADLTFVPGASAAAARNLHILFGRASHGDEYPFDGPGRVLAHTYFPNPPNPEPVAGDLHLDLDENWSVGGIVDLYSVVLHEVGHALGLGHADDPRAVMYPYYRRVSGLAPQDGEAIQQLYAAPGAGGAPAPAELPVVVVRSVQQIGTTLLLSGAASHSSGIREVRWTAGATGGVAAGTLAWSARFVPPAGVGEVRITAYAANGMQASVTQRISAPRGDTTVPVVTIGVPATVTSATSADTARVSGTATDAAGIAVVRWSTNTGLSGVANGTTRWEVPAIPLYKGYNAITIKAEDPNGNIGWRLVAITRQ